MNILIKKDAVSYPHKKHWQFCVGSGHALLALRTDYVKQLKYIHDTLGVERVRFHGIFDDDMRVFNDLTVLFPLPGAEEFTEYNFNNCALAYDNVLAAGMKPFVELSFMPRQLALREDGRRQQGMFFYHPTIVPPADYGRWKAFIQQFIRFLQHRYGIEEIRTWFFEVWNEPDLPAAFWNGSRDEYFRLYEETARAIKEVDAQIQVGGPSTSGSKWVTSFLTYCKAHDVPVDFVTTHQYAGDPLGGVEDQGEEEIKFDIAAIIEETVKKAITEMQSEEDRNLLSVYRRFTPDKSESTDIPNDVFIKHSKVVREQAGEMPLYYTEWNENSIFSAYTNDTRKVAAYNVKTALDVAENVDGSSIWCFSDIFEEFHPFPQEFHGGFGLLTQHGIPKPVYHAMKMLHDAGDERLDLGADATLGEVGYAAFRKGDAIQVLLFRQKMKNLPLPKENVFLRIERADAPQKVSVRRVDKEHGNPLRLWEDMGSPMMLNLEEIQTLTEKSAVTEEEWAYEYEDGQVRLSMSLGVNDVYFVTIQ